MKFRSLKLIVHVFRINLHCVKSVQIRSFFWSGFSCIPAEYGDNNGVFIVNFEHILNLVLLFALLTLCR